MQIQGIPVGKILLLLLVGFSESHTSISVEELERFAIESRLSLRSAVVTSKVAGFNPSGGFALTETLAFDEDRIKEVQVLPYIDGSGPKGVSDYTVTTIRTPTVGYKYSTEILPDNKTFVLTLEDDPSSRPIELWEGISNPRLLGLSGFYRNECIGSNAVRILSSPNRSDIKLDYAEFSGDHQFVLGYFDTVSQVTVEARFKGSIENNLYFLKREFEVEGVEYVDSCSVDYSNQDGLWLPVKVVYSRTEDDIETEREESLIEYKLVNETIPDAEFLPLSIGVPAGTNVAKLSDPENSYFWDGEKVVKKTDGYLATPGLVENERSSWLFVGINLLLGAIIILVYISGKWRRQTAG